MDKLERRVLLKFQRGIEEGKLSHASIVAGMTPEESEVFFRSVGIITEKDFEELAWDSEFWLRPKQKVGFGGDAPYITALVAGRGFG